MYIEVCGNCRMLYLNTFVSIILYDDLTKRIKKIKCLYETQNKEYIFICLLNNASSISI